MLRRGGFGAEYESRNIPEELKVEYEGNLQVLPPSFRNHGLHRPEVVGPSWFLSRSFSLARLSWLHSGRLLRRDVHAWCMKPECFCAAVRCRWQILPDGQPALTGSWVNVLEGTHGSFACRMEE